MLKVAVFIAALLFGAPAFAQNVTCFTASNGDSTNKCASTAFVQDAISGPTNFVNVLSFFSAAQKADIQTGTPTLNLTAAIQAAADSVIAAPGALGNTLYFPPGTYRFDSTIFIPSNTRVLCSAPGATVFKPIYNFTMFTNEVVRTRNLANDSTPVTPANQPDHNIAFEGCGFDMTAATGVASPTPLFAGDVATPIRFYYMQNCVVSNSQITGLDNPTSSGGGWIGSTGAFITQGVTGCRLVGNNVTGTLIGFDHWQGSNNLEIAGNIIVNSNNETAHRPNGYCIGVNGRGSLPSDHNTASNITIKNNYCTTGGYQTGGIQFDTLSAGSQVNKITIDNNVVIGRSGGTNQQGIYARGVVNDVTITNNKIEGVQNLPILVTENFSTGGPFTCTDCITTTNGSSSVVVAITTLTSTKVVVGNYLLFSSGTGAVGGITFAAKYFLVTAVNSGVSVTVTADVPASADATGGGSVSTNVYWGAPNRVTIAGNSFLNTDYAGNALIRVIGQNLSVTNTKATGGTYGAVTYTSPIVAGVVTTPAPVVHGTQGAAGSGIAGSGGNNIDNYAVQRHPITPFPSLALACGTAPAAPIDGQMWCTTAAVFARINGATKTLTDLESAQSVTGAKTFSANALIGTNLLSGVNQVVGARVTGWGAPTGTLDRTALATYAGQTVSAGYVQAEAQATDDACKKASQELGALITDLRTHGLIGN